MKTKVMKLTTLLLVVYAMEASEKEEYKPPDNYLESLNVMMEPYKGSSVFQENGSRYYSHRGGDVAANSGMRCPKFRAMVSMVSSFFPNQNSHDHEPQYFRLQDGPAVNMEENYSCYFAEKIGSEKTRLTLLDPLSGKKITCTQTKTKKKTVDQFGNETYEFNIEESTEYFGEENAIQVKNQVIECIKRAKKQLLDNPFSLELTAVGEKKKCDKCNQTFPERKAFQLKKFDPNICCDAILHEDCVYKYLNNGKCPHGLFAKYVLRKGENRKFEPNFVKKMALIWKNSNLCIYGFITIALIASTWYNFRLHLYDPSFASALNTIRTTNTDYSCFFTWPTVTMISDYYALFASFVVAFKMKKKGIPIDLIERISKKEVYLPLGGGTVVGLILGIVGLAYGGGPVALFALPAGLLGGLAFLPWGKIFFNFGIGFWCLSALFQIITTVVVNQYRYNKVTV